MSTELKTPTSPAEEFKSLVVELKEQFGKNAEGVEAINTRLDKLEFDQKTRAVNIDPNTTASMDTKEFNEYFRTYARSKDNRSALAEKQYTSTASRKGMEKKDTDNHVRFVLDSAGALLMAPQITREIIKNVTEYTPIMSLARVTPVGASKLVRRARTSTPGLVFIEEEGESEKKKIKYANIEIVPKKLGATYAATWEQLEDMDYDFTTEIVEAFREDWDVTIGAESLTGNGIRSLKGMIGDISNFNSGGTSLTTDMLIHMQESLKEPYQRNAQWLFTRATRGYIRSLVLSATNGLQYTWEVDFQRRSPTLLLGNPVYIANEGSAELPTLASRSSGAFSTGAVPVIYGDFKQGYEIALRKEMEMVDDPYSEASTWVRNFHIMSRIGGKVIKKEALTQLTITNS